MTTATAAARQRKAQRKRVIQVGLAGAEMVSLACVREGGAARVGDLANFAVMMLSGATHDPRWARELLHGMGYSDERIADIGDAAKKHMANDFVGAALAVREIYARSAKNLGVFVPFKIEPKAGRAESVEGNDGN